VGHNRAWAAAGVLLELGGILLPRAFGWSDLIDAVTCGGRDLVVSSSKSAELDRHTGLRTTPWLSQTG
jgi:hypothetical protein